MKKIFKTDLITDYMKQNALTKNDFCNVCNISAKEYDMLFNQDCEIELLTLFKIAKFFKIHVKDLFIK